MRFCVVACFAKSTESSCLVFSGGTRKKTITKLQFILVLRFFYESYGVKRFDAVFMLEVLFLFILHIFDYIHREALEIVDENCNSKTLLRQFIFKFKDGVLCMCVWVLR